MGLVYDVEAGLCGAHPVGICTKLVGTLLPVFIVLLFAYAEHGEDNVAVMCGMNVEGALTRFSHETEVFGNDRQWCHVITPLGVIDGLKDSMMVGAPLRFLEASVATKDESVGDGSD